MKSDSVVLLVIVIAVVMSGVDTNIVILAMPALVSSLGTNLTMALWIQLIYTVVVTALVTQFGRLGDIRGRSSMFGLGLLVFAGSSALAGLSQDVYELLLFRGLQGVGGALILSNSTAILSDYFSDERRGYAFGWTTAGWNIGAILGIFLGGVLTTFLSWRWDFYITVFAGVAGYLLAVRYLKKPQTRIDRRLDLQGSALLAISLSLVTLGGLTYPSHGLSTDTASYLAGGLVVFLAFLAVERHQRDPILDMALLRIRLYTASVGAVFLAFLASYATLFLLSIYLQGVRGLDPFYAALYLVPGNVVGSLAGSLGGRLSDIRDPRKVATLGLVIQAVSYFLYAVFLNGTVSFYMIVALSAVSGVGGSLFFSSNFKLIMRDVPSDMYGMASGMMRTTTNIGMIVSYALAVVVAAIVIPGTSAFLIFSGSAPLTGPLMQPFIQSVHYAILVSALIMIPTILLSWVRKDSAFPGENRVELREPGP